jgi:hypothetical protein
MLWQFSPTAALLTLTLAWAAVGSSPAGEGLPAGSTQWRAVPGAGLAAASGPVQKAVQPAAHEGQPPAGHRTPQMLPTEHGQIWREYDIRPYTSRVQDRENPQQAVRDWILRETGTEVWHSEPLGLLCVTPEKVCVYHTRQMQAKVADMVERLVANAAEPYAFGLRLLTVASPGWRATVHQMLRPMAVETPGVEAWLLSKEDAARLVAQLCRRSDAVEHNSPQVRLHHGQTHTVQRTRPVPHIRSVLQRPDSGPNYQLQMGQIDEGITVQVSPLLARDRRTVDAVVSISILQLEKLASVWMNVPTTVDARQRTQIQVPQTSSWHLHERFRWPTDQVLLLSGGMVPAPAAARPPAAVLPTQLFGSPRADLLLLLEAEGPAGQSVAQQAAGPKAEGPRYRGRY